MPTSLICVDANLVVRLVAAPRDEVTRGLWRQWEFEERRLVAPVLLRYEVTNALYRYYSQGLLSEAAIRRALRWLLGLPVVLHAEDLLYERAFELAERFSLRAAYDAHYLALAEHLGAEFWTADGRLARTVRPDLPWVHMVGE